MRAVIAAAAVAFIISLFGTPIAIRVFTALKAGQPIRTAEEVHRLAELHSSKQGVPTMGGVLVIGTVLLSISLTFSIMSWSFLWCVRL